MKVLVACEYSGTVRDAFSEKGHDAWSCDLLPTESKLTSEEGRHFQRNVLEVLNHGWDLMVAHPPCTFISRAGARWMYPNKGEVDKERFKKALEAREFFLELLNNKNIDRICVENPTPLKLVGLPEPNQVIQPYQFGAPYSKRTLLWLKGLPPLEPTKIVSEYKPYLPSNTGGKKKGQKHQINSMSQKESSRFFKGIAEAMADQWGV